MLKSTDWLPLQEALLYLEKKDMNISRVGLIKMGAIYRFSRKQKDGYHWEFNKYGLDEYIISQTPPGNRYVTISELSEIFHTTYTIIYNYIHNMNIDKLYRKGQIYVNKQRFIKQYKESNHGKK